MNVPRLRRSGHGCVYTHGFTVGYLLGAPSALGAEHIAQAIPGARLVTLKDCGHFPYLECPAPLREQIDAFFGAR